MASILNATGYTITSSNVVSSVVLRDGSGNFSAGTITAALTGNASTATALQTARNIGGVSFNGTADIVPQTIQSVNEGTDTTCFPLFINDSGTQSEQPKNNASFIYNSSANSLTLAAFNFTGTTLTSTNTIMNFDNTYAKGNYIRVGGSGRNIGVTSGGPLFSSFNLDYDSTASGFKYNSSTVGFVVILGQTTGQLGYAVSGTAGNSATIVNAATWDTSGDFTLPNGSLLINTAGKGINIKGGSNARVGTGAVLVAGTVTVSTTAVATGDIILLSCTAAGGTQGTPRISAISNGTSFTITSSNGADTSTYSWVIIRPT